MSASAVYLIGAYDVPRIGGLSAQKAVRIALPPAAQPTIYAKAKPLPVAGSAKRAHVPREHQQYQPPQQEAGAGAAAKRQAAPVPAVSSGCLRSALAQCFYGAGKRIKGRPGGRLIYPMEAPYRLPHRSL